MPNPHPPLENLKPIQSTWRHTPTKRLRFPATFEAALIDYARRLDRGEVEAATLEPDVVDRLVRSHFRHGKQSETYKSARALVYSVLAELNKNL